MENQKENQIPQEQEQESRQQGYVPRPKWQLWAARVGLVLFLLLVILQCVQIARGGM